MSRAFCVLVDQASYDCKTGKMKNEMTCYTQLMGPTAAVNGLKELCTSVNKNDAWKNENMEKCT